MNMKNFCVNMGYGSSWVIFEGLPTKNKEIKSITLTKKVAQQKQSEEKIKENAEDDDDEDEEIEMSIGDLGSDIMDDVSE